MQDSSTQSPELCDADPSAMCIQDAQQRIQSLLNPSESAEIIDCRYALARVTAEAVLSPRSVPSFKASSMDGYAIRLSECQYPLRIAEHSTAGHPSRQALKAKTCQRVTTGAMVPEGADAVIQQELVEVADNCIHIKSPPEPGQNIRIPGSDSEKGSVLIDKGCELGAAETGLLAAHGVQQIKVIKRLQIALFSTGDELVDPGSEPGPGQIYDANRPMLKSLLAVPSVDVHDHGVLKDTHSAVMEGLSRASDADLIISSGGVSVGEADHVKAVLEHLGSVNLWKIAMKPGRPLTFGLLDQRIPYFGLPGNPVSAAVTCLMFVRPAIRRLYGMQKHSVPPMYLPLASALRKRPGRVEFQRALMHTNSQGQWQVSTTGLQDSHVLSSLHKANCFVELDVESSGAEVGDMVRVIPFAHFSSDRL